MPTCMMHMDAPKMLEARQLNPPQLKRGLNSTATVYSVRSLWTAVSARPLDREISQKRKKQHFEKANQACDL